MFTGLNNAGVCSTCRTRVIDGECDFETIHALEDYEVEWGLVKLGSAFQQVINWSLSMTLESIMNGQICLLTWFFPKC